MPSLLPLPPLLFAKCPAAWSFLVQLAVVSEVFAVSSETRSIPFCKVYFPTKHTWRPFQKKKKKVVVPTHWLNAASIDACSACSPLDAIVFRGAVPQPSTMICWSMRNEKLGWLERSLVNLDFLGSMCGDCLFFRGSYESILHERENSHGNAFKVHDFSGFRKHVSSHDSTSFYGSWRQRLVDTIAQRIITKLNPD